MADNETRKQFGGRTLQTGDDPFKHNAWDNVEWTEEQKLEAQSKIDKQTTAFHTRSESESILLKGEVPFSEAWHKFQCWHVVCKSRSQNTKSVFMPNTKHKFKHSGKSPKSPEKHKKIQ